MNVSSRKDSEVVATKHPTFQVVVLENQATFENSLGNILPRARASVEVQNHVYFILMEPARGLTALALMAEKNTDMEKGEPERVIFFKGNSFSMPTKMAKQSNL